MCMGFLFGVVKKFCDCPKRQGIFHLRMLYLWRKIYLNLKYLIHKIHRVQYH